MANNTLQREIVDRRSRRQGGIDGDIAETLMGAALMVICQPRFEDMSQVVLAEDDEVVETLRLCSAHPNFRVGI